MYMVLRSKLSNRIKSNFQWKISLNNINAAGYIEIFTNIMVYEKLNCFREAIFSDILKTSIVIKSLYKKGGVKNHANKPCTDYVKYC